MTEMAALVAAEVKGMDYETKFQWVKDEKEKGNQMFKDKKYSEASDQYLRSLCGMEFKDKANDEEVKKKVNLDLKAPVLNNLSLCLIHLK